MELNRFFLKALQIDLLLKFNVQKYCVDKHLIYFLGDDDSIIYFTFINDIAFSPYEKIQMNNEQEIIFLDKINISDIDLNCSISEEKILSIEIEKDNIKIKSTNYTNIDIETNLDKQNNIENKIEFMLFVEHLIEFLKLDCFDSFKTFIDNEKICFKNEDIQFITMLSTEE